ncbi:phospholipase A2-like [Trichoplusia ni]|uniref:Phospholipase A2 n=1 Tax=Trichoplusia ni TaxID=7111 RepID=A0A7E5VH05_TRINI|nr:phospholipase A2-like [Trichoplusia ni]XP_026727486.1 phospholipase A2-like [Trichoplusia ni]
MLAESSTNVVSNDEVDYMKADASQPTHRINLIFPGTKWCGSGNVAADYDDLGPSKEADICCRAHDHCPDIIPGGETKYNLTNNAFYTRLHCTCDIDFLECLRSANTKVAKYIGITYFDALKTKCFKEDYPITKCNKKGGWFNAKCTEYEFDKSGKPTYQWFDVPNFK